MPEPEGPAEPVGPQSGAEAFLRRHPEIAGRWVNSDEGVGEPLSDVLAAVLPLILRAHEADLAGDSNDEIAKRIGPVWRNCTWEALYDLVLRERAAAYLAGRAAGREEAAAKAREYAEHYPQGSDGRNTFILLAEWLEAQGSLP